MVALTVHELAAAAASATVGWCALLVYVYARSSRTGLRTEKAGPAPMLLSPPDDEQPGEGPPLNRKHFRNQDSAVSPVIAVILMVAITVVLAATVYVWVSGFGAGGGNAPAHTLAITSSGAIVDTADAAAGTAASDIWTKSYTVASADPSLTYGDLNIQLAGEEATFDATGCDAAATAAATTQWGACAGSTDRAADDAVIAGDKIRISCYQQDTDCLTNADLLILDIQSNSVMVTLKVR